MSVAINSSYPLAALLIHATNQEVTKEKMEAVFKTLGLEFSGKTASFFVLSADKYSSMISNIGGSAPAAPSSASANAEQSAAAPAQVEEEESSAEIGFDF